MPRYETAAESPEMGSSLWSAHIALISPESRHWPC